MTESHGTRASALHELTASEQAELVRTRQVSPVELVSHHLDRIERLDGEIGAFVVVTAEQALEQARAAEKRVTETDELPPLHGVPTAIKDLAMTREAPTSFGSRAMRDSRAVVDADVVSALRLAGTISLGKTTTPEFGLTTHSTTDFGEETRTPWHTGYSAAGSSGGAAAAVAAGMVPFAQGSDGGGSIRMPASVCGLVGLKPSWGRTSDGPLLPDVARLSVRGALTRTVRDAALALDVIAGYKPGALVPIQGPAEGFLPYVDREPGRLRVGRYTAAPSGVPVDPECVRAVDVTTELLVKAGHDVEEIEPPVGADFGEHFVRLWALNAAGLPVPADKVELLRPITRWLREQGARISGTEALGLLATLQAAGRGAIERTAAYDLVLSPTLALPPRPIGWFTETGRPEDEMDRMGQFAGFTPLQNVTGQPAVSLPVHWTADGLPVGAMLTGRPAGEATLISVAAQLEGISGWPSRLPPSCLPKPGSAPA